VYKEDTGDEVDGIPVVFYHLVEVVRRGKYNTRIRRDLDGNSRTELVPTYTLSNPTVV
jgi:hypothetical protein